MSQIILKAKYIVAYSNLSVELSLYGPSSGNLGKTGLIESMKEVISLRLNESVQ